MMKTLKRGSLLKMKYERYLSYEEFKELKSFLDDINPCLYHYMRQEWSFPFSGYNHGQISEKDIEGFKEIFC